MWLIVTPPSRDGVNYSRLLPQHSGNPNIEPTTFFYFHVTFSLFGLLYSFTSLDTFSSFPFYAEFLKDRTSLIRKYSMYSHDSCTNSICNDSNLNQIRISLTDVLSDQFSRSRKNLNWIPENSGAIWSADRVMVTWWPRDDHVMRNEWRVIVCMTELGIDPSTCIPALQFQGMLYFIEEIEFQFCSSQWTLRQDRVSKILQSVRLPR